MSQNINSTELQALAFVLSEQALKVRLHLLKAIAANPASALSVCTQQCPTVKWTKLIEQASMKIEDWRRQGIYSSSYFEDSYPAALRTLEDPALILFYKGQALSVLDNHLCLAIVGSRRAGPEGLEISSDFATKLAKFGIVIVSGLALGIDGAAHRGALRARSALPTVAVLGSGLNMLYPPSHAELHNQIVENGGIVISQFEPQTCPYPSNFLNRNRIVSGLSKAVLVIEASLKSGSLVTARNAIEQGRDVFVVPGDIDNPRFAGSNKLIQQGANLVTSVQDIIELLGVSAVSQHLQSNRGPRDLSLPPAAKIERQILTALEQQREIKISELARQIGNISIEKELLMLEVHGLIQRMPGNVLRLRRG